MGQKNWRLKSLTKLLGMLRIAFFGYIAGNIILGIGAIFYLLDSDYASDYDVMTTGDWIGVGAALVYLPSLLASIILFCIFSVRAARNLKLWGEPRMEMAPGWTAGWYFVPFANLFQPYKAMNQIIDATDPQGMTVDFNGRVGLWWMLWLVTSIGGNMSFRLSNEAGGLTGEITNEGLFNASLWLDVLTTFTGVAAALIILKILKSIAEVHETRMAAEAF